MTPNSMRRAAIAAQAARERLPDPPTGAIGTRRSIVVERVLPQLDGGRHPVKRVVGDELLVTADIYADGHDLLDAALLIRAGDETGWREAPMRLVDNDRWSGSVTLSRNRRHWYTVEAWRDAYGSWREGLRKKVDAGVAVATELEEGALLLKAALDRAEAAEAGPDARLIRESWRRMRRARSEATRVAALAGEELLAAMRRHPDRSFATRHDPELELVVDRELARCAAWYELFPRSQGREPSDPRPAPTTFRGAEWRLRDIAAMGFDVVYLPPIHPIGATNRKGRNNSLTARRGDPGSPYAIGTAAGGHDTVAPELGGLDEFLHFRRAVERHGMEVALDLAIQASPDHPWVAAHPAWFRRSPDGTVKHAENPPKKYQDIYPFDFYGPDADARAELWQEWRRIVLTWVGRGVRIFRVDNPHTKPIPFWAWLIGEVQREHPDVIFLSEAFTKPKMMGVLAKIGFTQSYTYFTWRERPWELRDYLTELT
ncbi:MAG: maltotransferase domain-containing protein, partial [Candidatus Limnocylindria bacterium]